MCAKKQANRQCKRHLRSRSSSRRCQFVGARAVRQQQQQQQPSWEVTATAATEAAAAAAAEAETATATAEQLALSWFLSLGTNGSHSRCARCFSAASLLPWRSLLALVAARAPRRCVYLLCRRFSTKVHASQSKSHKAKSNKVENKSVRKQKCNNNNNNSIKQTTSQTTNRPTV